MNQKLKLVATSSCLTLLCGCATSGKSILLGSGIGAGVGAGLGNAIGQNTEGTLIGAASGATVGGLLGYWAHKDQSKKSTATVAESKDKAELPFLTKPEVRSIWVPDKIEGNQYIQGHRIFIIEKQSGWSR